MLEHWGLPMLPILPTSDPELAVGWPNSVKALARPIRPSNKASPMSSSRLAAVLVEAGAAVLESTCLWTAEEGVGDGVGEVVDSPAS